MDIDAQRDNSTFTNADKGEDNLEQAVEQLEYSDKDFLARKVQGEFARFKGARYIQENIWLRAHYNYKGQYDPNTLGNIAPGKSQAFVQATRPRVQTAVAMLMPILIPPGDRAWTIDPTPKPLMPDLKSQLIAQGLSNDVIDMTIRDAAESAAYQLSDKVDDGFVETSFPTKLQRTVLDACLYGTSVLQGPTAVSMDTEPKVANKSFFQQISSWLSSQEDSTKYRPEIDVLSPWDFYPDPGARTIDEATAAINRKLLSFAQLRDLRNVDGFNTEAIDEVLAKYGENGNWSPEWWESRINIANSQQQMTMPNGRFVCLIRWGYISGRDLQKAGLQIDKSLLDEQVMAQLWVIGNKVISCRVSELHRERLPFYVTPFSVVPHTMWGAGIPEMMFDSQDAINACERAKMDNMALSSRPQVVVHADRLLPGHNHLEMTAGKIWVVNQSEVSGQGKPVEFFVPECRMDQLRLAQQDSIAFAQEQTAMPNFLMGVGGDGVHNRTLGGASMQFNAAITPLKGVVMNFENYLIIPLVQKMCDFYHQYDKTEAERGDYKVNAKGVSGLMAREVTAQRVAQVMQIAGQNPDWARRTNLDRVYNLMLKDSGLSSEGLVLPDEVVQQRMQQEEAQKAQMQMAVAQQESMIQQKQRAETAPKDALIEAMKQAPESSLLKTILIKKVLEVEGLMDEEIMAAFQHEADLQSIKDHDSVELIGQAKADRQPQIVVNNHPAPPKSISVKRDANGNIIGYERVMAGEDENV